MARRDYEGHAVQTTITAQVNPTDLSITITASTGWPTGGVNGEFFVTVNPDLINEERILVASRSGSTLTIANTGKRGQDGTSAQTHAAGSIIRHSYAAVEADEANFHINDVTHDHHTQYMKSDGTRHDLTARHAYGAALGTRPTPIAVGTSLAAGSGATPSAGDHQHTIGTGAINSAVMFAAGVIDSAAIGTGAVGSDEIATGAVGSDEIATGAVGSAEIANGAIDDHAKFSTDTQPFIVQAGDPGAVGANKVWFDTTARYIKVRNAGNSGWDIFGARIVPWTDYTPVTTNLTIGNGNVYGRFMKVDKLVVGVLGLLVGSTTVFTASNFGFSLPSAANFSSPMNTANAEWLSGGRASDSSTNSRAASIGRITSADATQAIQWATLGTLGWDATSPFTWAVNDKFAAFFMYEEV